MKDRLCQWIAQHLPRRLMYFCYIKVHAEATCRAYSYLTPDEITWGMALDVWERKVIKSLRLTR